MFLFQRPSEADAVNIRRSRPNFKPRLRPPALPPARLAYLAGRIHTVGPRGLYELLQKGHRP
jgi:hypothetical protein